MRCLRISGIYGSWSEERELCVSMRFFLLFVRNPSVTTVLSLERETVRTASLYMMAPQTVLSSSSCFVCVFKEFGGLLRYFGSYSVLEQGLNVAGKHTKVF